MEPARSTRLRRPSIPANAVTLVGLALAGCSFDAGVPAGATISCSSDADSVTLTPPSGSLLNSVTRVGVGTAVTIAFTVNEPLTTNPTVATSSPEVLSFTYDASSGNTFVFAHTLDDLAHAQGEYTIVVEAIDLAGNSGNIELALPAPGFVVDTVAPPTLGITELGRLLYTRIPWGNDASGGDKQFIVESTAAGAVEPDCTVIIWDEQNPDSAGELGRGVADGQGTVSPISLIRIDWPVVWLGQVDAAANAATNVRLTEVVWNVTMGRKLRGSSIENPHELEEHPWFGPVLLQPGVVTPQSPIDAARSDGAVVTSRGRARWQQRVTASIDPAARTRSFAAYDAARGRGVLFGGYFAQAYFEDTWEWDGNAWDALTPIDPEADGDPETIASGAATYDAGRGVVVLFGGRISNGATLGDSDTTWEWNGTSWRRATPTDPEQDGNPSPRYDHALAFDSARASSCMAAKSTSARGAMRPGNGTVRAGP